MDTPPPVPFGDPTQVQKENRSALGKGLLFGCSGCLLVILALGIFVAAIVGVVMASLRNSEPFQITLDAAKNSAEMRQAVGEPMTIGWIMTGNVKYNGGEGEADVYVPINGPSGSAYVHTVGRKAAGNGWDFSQMTAVVEGTGQTVELRPKKLNE